MEKINIAELLKDCPTGMELDCTEYDGFVKFEGFNKNNPYAIRIVVAHDGVLNVHNLTKYGQTSISSYNKCVIFPKGKTTWEGFVPPCKFKVGDRIVKRNSIGNSWIVTSVSSEYYGLKLPKGSESIGVLAVSEQDNYELVQNKFDITTLKPFDKVLVRYDNYNPWVATHFSHYTKDAGWELPYFASGACFMQCIPFEGNQHLLGTTNDCEDFYKTWE